MHVDRDAVGDVHHRLDGITSRCPPGEAERHAGPPVSAPTTIRRSAAPRVIALEQMATQDWTLLIVHDVARYGSMEQLARFLDAVILDKPRSGAGRDPS